MRVSEHRDWRSGSRTLQVNADKRESLEYSQAEWLRGATEPFLLRFTYDPSVMPPRFYYDVTGLARLKTYLKAKITGPQFQGMLVTIHDAMGLCTRQGYPTNAMCFDPENAYVADGGGICFAFVPLSGCVERSGGTARALLEYLASKSHVRFVVEDDIRYQRALDDFVRRTPVLSIATFREFLGSEMGVSVGGDSGSLTPARAPRPAVADPWPAVSGTAAKAASFDMVGMLSHRSSASEVTAKQGVAERAVNGVAGISPTAAPVARGSATSGFVATSGPVEAPVPETAPVPEATSGPEAEPGHEEAEPEPEAAPRSKIARRSETVLLGSRAGSVAPAPGGPAHQWVVTRFLLVRERDGSRLGLDLSRPVTVGRSMSADVQVEGNGSLSRCHARLSRDGDGFLIEDLGSLNGVYVRGKRLPREGCTHIALGERFCLADEKFCVLAE
ncbi:FHA domain-containing protein [Tractidigestivibacter sp.]|uniref:FHA domain-containing protein n=1 Tax=Tractidigestivibacter sp. TaxID=2847320 RepID=UPI002A91DD5C|nr:FHA domain-containing protein [Tractidigestivibacter sp.]MCI6274486.1 FHA domain-containing protein [Coriobacteriaceae bacterium]MDY5271879.1 FHA domain-containing protein [Tractidigestivibacter sp.]